MAVEMSLKYFFGGFGREDSATGFWCSTRAGGSRIESRLTLSLPTLAVCLVPGSRLPEGERDDGGGVAESATGPGGPMSIGCNPCRVTGDRHGAAVGVHVSTLRQGNVPPMPPRR